LEIWSIPNWLKILFINNLNKKKNTGQEEANQIEGAQPFECLEAKIVDGAHKNGRDQEEDDRNDQNGDGQTIGLQYIEKCHKYI
jgi:hypothetical protein